MAARNETPPNAGTIDCFPDHPLFEELQWFKGTVDPRQFVLNYIDLAAEKTETDMKKRGMIAPWRSGEKVKVEVIRTVREYISLIRRVCELTCRKIDGQFAEDDLRVIQARTVFDFETWLARVMLVVDALPDKILEFSQLLSEIETALLMEEGFVVELNYVNKRCSNIDCAAIRRDFPFVGRVATRPKCARCCDTCTLE